jgi:uncharacterized membrane protein
VTVTTPTQSAESLGDAASGGRVPPGSAWWVLLAGVAGLVASATLTVEKIDILRDPSYRPSCNINPVLSCGSVMQTPQASLLGLPNPLVGIAAFSVVLVTGVLAVAKVSLPQWYWIGLTMGALVGAGFVHWLIFESLYRIGALCPYCMVVWAVTMTLLVVVASIAFGPLVERSAVARGLFQWRWSITALWFTTVILVILARFWDYWSTLL